jgi:signal transduction histidine kinase
MRTLRSRLILSHLIPVLVVVPVFGILLIYILETQVLLESTAAKLTEQATVIAEVANTQPGIWREAGVAQEYVGVISRRLDIQIMLLDRNGVLLAATDPAYVVFYGELVEVPGSDVALAGESSELERTGNLGSVTVPALNSEEQVIGLVHVSEELSGAAQLFGHLRNVVLAVIIGELLLGVIVGLSAALFVERPVGRVTAAINRVVEGEALPIPEEGPLEIRQLASAFNSLLNRLQMLEEARQRLLANLVHELGRPLGALRSAVYSLRAGAAADIALRQDLLDGMESELRRMQPMLDDLAQLSDRALGAMELRLEATDLKSWLPTILAPWREAAYEKEIVWRLDLRDAPEVQVDRNRLAQAIGNLVSNALRYTPAGGHLSIGAGAQDNWAWISILDNGPGIPEEERQRIFEPFYRGAQAQRFPQGLGLGLTISKEMIEAHGGTLELDSSAGQGSRFVIRLPLVRTS